MSGFQFSVTLNNGYSLKFWRTRDGQVQIVLYDRFGQMIDSGFEQSSEFKRSTMMICEGPVRTDPSTLPGKHFTFAWRPAKYNQGKRCDMPATDDIPAGHFWAHRAGERWRVKWKTSGQEMRDMGTYYRDFEEARAAAEGAYITWATSKKSAGTPTPPTSSSQRSSTGKNSDPGAS